MKRTAMFLGGMLVAVSVAAATVEAPLDVRKPGDVKFAAEPAVSKAGGRTKITFEVSAATDVEVAIVNAKGRVVRHLAAGLLGKNAPAPFAKNSLKQSVTWDGKDDAGRAAKGGLFKARVRIGSTPKLVKYLGRDDATMAGGIGALTVGPKGELFVLLADSFRGRAEMRVLDRDGKYVRTILPYSDSTPLERTEPVGHLMIDGKRQPMVFSGQGHCFAPLVAGLRGQTMAWHPDGYLIAASAVGSMCDHGPPRYLIALHPDGGAPPKVGYVGPRIRKPRGFFGGAGEGNAGGLDRLAVSPDGQWIYLVQSIRSYYFKKERQHGVFRLKWTDKEATAPWLGKKQAGAGDDEFNDPQGLAVDVKGNLYVCDRGNNRVKVYSPEGKRLGKFAVPDPMQIAVHPKNGEIYLLSRPAGRSYDLVKRPKKGQTVTSRLLKLSAWSPDAAPKELARLEFPVKKRGARVVELIALDPTGDAPRLWATFYGGWRRPSELRPTAVEGNTFKLGLNVNRRGGLHYPSFIAADPDRRRVIIYEHLNAQAVRGHRVIDTATGKITVPNTRGSDLTVDAAGNLYVMDPYNRNSMSRYTPDWKPLPFPATGTNKLSFQYRAYGPSMGLRGHVVTPNGDIYVRRSPNHARISTVDVFGQDGKIKTAGLVRGTGSADCGIGVDSRGNIYLGLNLKPADRPLPAEFAKDVPALRWKYYRRVKRQPPWNYLYCNPYIFHMGSVFKFGPQGGTIYGNFKTKRGAKPEDPGLIAAKAPAGAAAYKSSYLIWDVKVVGAKWRYPGVGIIPSSFDRFSGDDGCSCMVTQLDADLYGRVYAPNVFRSGVEWIDSAGNRIGRIGTYGNADDEGLRFAWPTVCDFANADGRLYVTDSVNRRVVIVGFDYAAETTCETRPE